MEDGHVPERTKLVTTIGYPPESAHAGHADGDPFDPAPLTALIPQLMGDASSLGRQIRDTIHDLSAHALQVTFHLPLDALIGCDDIPISAHDYLYGSLRRVNDCSPAAAAGIAQACGTVIVIVEQHLFTQFLLRHPDLLPHRPLTARERTILTLLGEGMRQAQIAEALTISPNTVSTHCQNL